MKHENSAISKSDHKNNVYAHNIKHEVIHISEAPSGRKGYYCLGCDREMQAVHSQFRNRISYFRHDATDVKNNGKCTYSDETYRHKLAKEILQRIKEVRVPRVYKYPPKGEDGKAYLLSPSKLVRADKVQNELYFYEDETGEIRWSRAVTFKDEYLLFQPDVALFDSNDKPILLIELVATHKVSREKHIKMKRIGIDAVEVQIPKTSPEEIEAIFKVAEKTKWLYNNEEANTEYIPNAERDSTAILPPDDVQRKFFEEDVKCRSAEIANLIRSINRCLESKSYTDVREKLELDLRRVEENAEGARRRLLDVRDEHRKRVERKLSSETEEFENEEREFQDQVNDLETRYLSKREECEGEEERIDEEIKRAGDAIEICRYSMVNGREKIDLDEDGIRRDIERERRAADSLKELRALLDENKAWLKAEAESDEDGAQREYDDAEGVLRARIKSVRERRVGLPEEYNGIEKAIPGEFERLESSAREDYIRLETDLKTRISRARNKRDELSKRFREEEGRMREEFEGPRERIAESIKKRNAGGRKGLATKLETLVADFELLANIPSLQIELERIRTAQKAIDTRSYKNWI